MHCSLNWKPLNTHLIQVAYSLGAVIATVSDSDAALQLNSVYLLPLRWLLTT